MTSLAVVLEQRFDRTPDGCVWTESVFTQSFWARYLAHFDDVRVVARIRDIDRPSEGASRADVPRVTWAPVPWYLGPVQFLRQARQVQQVVQTNVLDADSVLLRVPSTLASLAVRALRRQRRTFGVEVVGDPHDVFAPGSVRTPLRPLFRLWYTRSLRAQCASACAAAYVTHHALQRRYPPASDAFTTHYSSIELPVEAIVATPRRPRTQGPLRIVTVGTLAQLYKGPDVLLEAAAQCIGAGVDLELDIVGDGRYRPELERWVAARGLERRVRFLGQLPAGAAVRAAMDAADLFVLASRQEGLPRAMIEAMARGLPCIGTTVGGIPELLARDALVPPNDVAGLAACIATLTNSPARRAQLAELNLRKAREFVADRLTARRDAFYHALRARTVGGTAERVA